MKEKKLFIRDYPVLKGFKELEGNSIIVWCSMCNTWHTHGSTNYDAKKSYGTYRDAHCQSASKYMACSGLFREYGYYVKQFSREERLMMYNILKEEFESRGIHPRFCGTYICIPRRLILVTHLTFSHLHSQ